LGKEVTNGAYWRTKNQDSVKRGHQQGVLAPEKSRFWKNRSLIRRIGARKIKILEKEVTNGSYWRPKKQDSGKRGHQRVVDGHKNKDEAAHIAYTGAFAQAKTVINAYKISEDKKRRGR